MRSIYEKRVERIFKRNGFIADYKVRPPFPIPGYNVDYFGLFDNMFYKDGVLHLVQVKGKGDIPKELRERIQNFPINKVIREIWVFKSNKKIKRLVYK